MESSRDRPLSLPARLLLAAFDPVVFFFMRSATVKTVLVDRRPGEEGKRSRIRAAERGIELAAGGEQIWIFFEGGRSRIPDEIRPARGGIGQVVRGLQARGIRPVVIAIHHRGLEQVIPISSRRWLTSGHRIDIRWSEFDMEGRAPTTLPSTTPRGSQTTFAPLWCGSSPTGVRSTQPMSDPLRTADPGSHHRLGLLRLHSGLHRVGRPGHPPDPRTQSLLAERPRPLQ